MKITRMTAYPVPPRWLFLKIETYEAYGRLEIIWRHADGSLAEW